MGLFSRRKAAVVDDSWQPLTSEIDELAGDRADMDDDGQATDLGYRAYEAAFASDAAPYSMITVWTYAVFAGDEEYGVSLRYQYIASETGWSYVGYHDDPLEEVFGTAERADAEAHAWAAVLAAGNPDSMGNLPDVFEWDGEPFPVGDPG